MEIELDTMTGTVNQKFFAIDLINKALATHNDFIASAEAYLIKNPGHANATRKLANEKIALQNVMQLLEKNGRSKPKAGDIIEALKD